MMIIMTELVKALILSGVIIIVACIACWYFSDCKFKGDKK